MPNLFKMKKAILLSALIVLVTAFSVLTLPALAVKKPGKISSGKTANINKTTFGKIDSAVKKGRISKDYSLLLKARALLDSDSLPEHYRGKPVKDGTFILMDIRKQLGKVKIKRFKSKIKSLVEPVKVNNDQIRGRGASYGDATGYNGGDYGGYFTTLTNLTELYSFGNFDIRYTKTGTDAVPPADSDVDGTPDYIENAGTILENVWSKQTGIANMGYSEPAGTSTRFQIFFKDISAYGLTYPLADTGAYKSRAFIVMENDFTGFGTPQLGALQVTSAHEFFHAIQFAYNDFSSDSGKNRWWMEATATWMEDEIYPAVDDYLGYIYSLDEYFDPDGWFAYPENSLATFNGSFEYGSIMFIKYLQQRFGGGVTGQGHIKSIFASLNGYNFSTTSNSIIAKIQAELTSNGDASFGKVYSDFMTQNYIIDPAKSSSLLTRYTLTDAVDIDGRHDYSWGGGTSNIFIYNDPGVAYGTIQNAADGYLPQYLGTNFNIVNGPAAPVTASFNFLGDKDLETNSKTATWSVQLLLQKGDDSFDIQTLVAPGGTSGTLNVGSFGTGGTYEKAIFVISVVGATDTSKKYKYSYSSIGKQPSSISRPAAKSPYILGSTTGIVFTSVITPAHAGKTNIILEKRSTVTGDWTSAGAMTWDSALGKYKSKAQKPTSRTYYRARWTGDIDHSSSASSVTLLPIPSFSFSKSSVATNAKTLISGTVSPNLKGKNIIIQKYNGGWKNIATKTLNTYSKFSYSWSSGVAGKFKFRIKVPAATGRVASYSTTKTVTVL